MSVDASDVVLRWAARLVALVRRVLPRGCGPGVALDLVVAELLGVEELELRHAGRLAVRGLVGEVAAVVLAVAELGLGNAPEKEVINR